MLNWLRSKPVCPIDSAVREWIDVRWEWLEQEFGTQRLRQTPVILPTAEFFPDPFDGTEEHARRELDRLCRYMGLDPATIDMSLYADRNPVHTERGREGTAGLYHPEGNRFRIWIEVGNLDHPMAMLATMAHELGHVHLLGHGRITNDIEDHEPLTDLLTVFFGIGVLTANAVIQESNWNYGQYSSWSISRGGYLGMNEFAYALARFAQSRGENGSAWMKELRLDVRAPFKQSMRYLQANGGKP